MRVGAPAPGAGRSPARHRGVPASVSPPLPCLHQAAPPGDAALSGGFRARWGGRGPAAQAVRPHTHTPSSSAAASPLPGDRAAGQRDLHCAAGANSKASPSRPASAHTSSIFPSIRAWHTCSCLQCGSIQHDRLPPAGSTHGPGRLLPPAPGMRRARANPVPPAHRSVAGSAATVSGPSHAVTSPRLQGPLPVSPRGTVEGL